MPWQQIDEAIFLGLGTEDKKVTAGGLVGWFGLISHRTGNEAALAIVANAGTARPTNGNIAGFRQLEEILIFCIPSNREAATCKRHLRPVTRGPCRGVN